MESDHVEPSRARATHCDIHVVSSASRGQVRDDKHDTCVEGLRNPNQRVARSSAARSQGERRRTILEQELASAKREVTKVHAITGPIAS